MKSINQVENFERSERERGTMKEQRRAWLSLLGINWCLLSHHLLVPFLLNEAVRGAGLSSCLASWAQQPQPNKKAQPPAARPQKHTQLAQPHSGGVIPLDFVSLQYGSIAVASGCVACRVMPCVPSLSLLQLNEFFSDSRTRARAATEKNGLDKQSEGLEDRGQPVTWS